MELADFEHCDDFVADAENAICHCLRIGGDHLSHGEAGVVAQGEFGLARVDQTRVHVDAL